MSSVDRELDALQGLVLEAAALVGETLAGALPVATKAGTEFVTETDRRSEDLLVAGLGRLFPGESIQAEESGTHEGVGAGGRRWFVDPLDGTTNFAHGHPFYCVSVGAADDQGPCLAAVCAPALGDCYLAARGKGAKRLRLGEGEPVVLPLRHEVPLNGALLATGFPYVRDDLVLRNTRLVAAFLTAPCHGVRRDGSAALDLCHVAAGRLDGYWEFRLRPWDTAAGILVARECGVVVTRADGAADLLPHADILAAPPGLHAAMKAVIAATGEDRCPDAL